MKKPILLLFAIAIGCNCFAQKSTSPVTHKWMYVPQVNNVSHLFSGVKPALKGSDTVYSDTITYWNNKDTQIDSAGFYLYSQIYQDEGYTFGTNIDNDMGYAELYDVKVPADTTIQILGLLSAWHGVVQPGSTKSVVFKVWAQDNTLYLQHDSDYVQGFPGTAIYSQAVPISQLQMGNYVAPDTIPVITWFASPVTNVTSSFFAGYEINYNWNTVAGDTITLDATPQGNAVGVGEHHPDLSLPGSTVYTPRNAIEVTPGTWQDCYYDYGYKINLSIVPIIQYKYPLSVGITRNNLTFFGNYPNPATNYTNISFALKNTADVTVEIMDMQGKLLQVIRQPSLNEGAHILQVKTTGIAAGNYIYMIRTGEGDGMAGKLTISR